MPESNQPINVFWFRRDLRLEDNQGLAAALSQDLPVLTIFIFDIEILDLLPSNDTRVSFIHRQLVKLNETMEQHGTSMLTFHGSVVSAFEHLCARYRVHSVYCNHDYEPYAISRDSQIRTWLDSRGIQFQTFKDQVIFEKSQIVKDDGTPYTVFTPYMKTWKSELSRQPELLEARQASLSTLFPMDHQAITSLSSMGFSKQKIDSLAARIPDKAFLERYKQDRDFPAKNGTSRLSVHLRFGTMSIRKLVKAAMQYSNAWLNELIWREFYMMILWHFPRVVNECFRTEYNLIPWKNNPQEFERWCQGKTGYPLVDAGMRELNETGYMHNRLRMVTASFLSKHLLINWQWGEAYFAEKLLDYELSSNNGGWQWSAGCGCDAAPYFRVFNPWLQAEKFDPESKYIKKWVPEYGHPCYPKPMIEHQFARERALKTYKQTLQKHS